MTTCIAQRSRAAYASHAAHTGTHAQSPEISEQDLRRLRALDDSGEKGMLRISNRTLDFTIQALRREISRLERLRGIAVFEQDDKIVAVYRAEKKRAHVLRRLWRAERGSRGDICRRTARCRHVEPNDLSRTDQRGLDETN